MTNRLQQLERENKDLKKVTDDLRSLVLSLESRVKSLESSKGASEVQAPKPIAPAKAEAKPAAPADDDDDVDLFGSDSEDEEAERIKQERVAAYAAKKSNSITPKFFFYIYSLDKDYVLVSRACSDCQVKHYS